MISSGDGALDPSAGEHKQEVHPRDQTRNAVTDQGYSQLVNCQNATLNVYRHLHSWPRESPLITGGRVAV